jgi:hypothetical protein
LKLKYEFVYLKEYENVKEVYIEESKDIEKIKTDAERVQMLQSFSRPGILCTNLTSGNRGYIPLTLEKEGNQQLDLSKALGPKDKRLDVYLDHIKSFMVNRGEEFVVIDLEEQNKLFRPFSFFAWRYICKLGYSRYYFEEQKLYIRLCKYKEYRNGKANPILEQEDTERARQKGTLSL